MIKTCANCKHSKPDRQGHWLWCAFGGVAVEVCRLWEE